MKLIRTYGKTAAEAEAMLRQIEERSGAATGRLEPAVKRMLADIRRKGDAALRRYAERLDGLAPICKPPRYAGGNGGRVGSNSQRTAVSLCKRRLANIRRFARWQMPKEWTRKLPGVQLGQRALPLDSVGCYVPGGRYPLPSTLLMTVIPAQVAGVNRIVVVSPRPARETLAAAHLAGVKEFYRIGGAQAIAALAYGTASMPRVDKIVGPGNLYVTTAKKLVAFECGIDMLAGPTEIVVASEDGNPQWIAADLVAQAEHDPEALAVFVTSNLELAQARQRRQSNSRLPQTGLPVRRSRKVVSFSSPSRPMKLQTVTNRLAAEHLTIDKPGRSRLGAPCRIDFCWTDYTAKHGRLYLRPESRASDRATGPRARWIERLRFSPPGDDARIYSHGAGGAWPSR